MPPERDCGGHRKHIEAYVNGGNLHTYICTTKSGCGIYPVVDP